MNRSFKASCIQTHTTDDLDGNLGQIKLLMKEAHSQGADFVALPEACEFLSGDKAAMRNHACLPSESRALKVISELASQYDYWVLVGSLTVRHENGSMANRSFLLSPKGEVVSYYDKIHLFDANIPGNKGARESDLYNPGDRAVTAELPWGKLGMTICYDLRFPHLYRCLAHSGVHFITVPAAFAQMTGEAHWHSLLRARAIENGCFIIAPAQTGNHYGVRYSFGHSLIISPWGEVLADGGKDIGVITTTVTLDEIKKARSVIGSLSHDRSFSPPIHS